MVDPFEQYVQEIAKWTHRYRELRTRAVQEQNDYHYARYRLLHLECYSEMQRLKLLGEIRTCRTYCSAGTYNA